MPTRIVSWNCADWLGRKSERVLAIQPHIAIIPEVRAAHAGALGESYATVWDGDPGQRGLLIAASANWSLEVIHRASARHSMLVKASSGSEVLFIVGIWSMPKPHGYVGSVVRGLDELPPFASGAKVIVAGDFNASPVFDRNHPSTGHFSQIAERLRGRGLESLWHTLEGETFGEERRPTYFHQWKREQPFHIDFMFASSSLRERLTTFELGAYDDWCPSASDHMPLIASFELT